MRIKKFLLLLGFLNCLHDCGGGTAKFRRDYQNVKNDNGLQSGSGEKGHERADLRGKSKEFAEQERLGRQLANAFQESASLRTNKIGLEKAHIGHGSFGFNNIDGQTDSLSSGRFNELRAPSSSDGLGTLRDSSLAGRSFHESNPIVETNAFLDSLPPFGTHAIHSRSLLDTKRSLREANPSRRRKSYSLYASNPLDETDSIFESNPSSKSYSFQESNPSEEADAFLESISPTRSHSYVDQASSSEIHPFIESILAGTSLPLQRSSLSDGSIRQSKSPSGSLSYPDSNSLKTLSPFEASCLLDVLRKARKSSPLSRSISFHNISPRSRSNLYHDSSLSNGLHSLHGSDGSDFDLQSYSSLAPKLSDDNNRLRSLRKLRTSSGSNSYLHTRPLRKSSSYLDSSPLSGSHSIQKPSLSDGLCNLHPSIPTSGSYAYQASSLSDRERSLRQSIPSSRSGSYVKSSPSNRIRSLRESKPLTRAEELNLLQQINSCEDSYRNAIAELNMKNNEAGKSLIPYSIEDILAPSALVNDQQPMQDINSNEHLYNNMLADLHRKIQLIEKSLSQLTVDNSLEQPESINDQNDELLGGSNNFITKVFSKIAKTKTPSTELDVELPEKPSELINNGDSVQRTNNNQDTNQVDDRNGITEIRKKLAEAEKLLTQFKVNKDSTSSELDTNKNPFQNIDSNENYYRNVLAEINSKIVEAERPLSQFKAEDSLRYENDNRNAMAEIHNKIVEAEKPLAKFIAEEKLQSAGLASNQKPLQHTENNKEDFRKVIAEINNLIAEAEKPLSHFRAEDSLRTLDNQNLMHNTENHGNDYRNEIPEIHNKIVEVEKPMAQFNAEAALESGGLVTDQKPLQSTDSVKEDFRSVIAEINNLIADAEKPLSQYSAEDPLRTSNLIDNRNLLHGTENYRNDYSNEMAEIRNKIVEAKKPLEQFNAEAALESEGLVANQKPESNKEDFRRVISDLNNLIAEAEIPLSQYVAEDSLKSSKLIDNRNLLHGTENYENNHGNEVEEKIIQAKAPLVHISAEAPLKSDGLDSNNDDFRSVIAEINSQIAEAEKSLAKYSAETSLVPSKLVSKLNHVQGINDYSEEIAEIHKKIAETEKWLAQCKAEDTLENSDLMSNRVDNTGDVYCNLIGELHKKITDSEKGMQHCCVGDIGETSKLGNNQKFLDHGDSSGNNYRNAIAEIDSLIEKAEKPVSGLVNNIQDNENLRSKRTLKIRDYQNADNKIKANICPAKNPQQPTSNSNCKQTSSGNDQQDLAERVKDILSSMRKHTSEMMKNMCDLESDLMATDGANDFTKITNNIDNNRRIYPNALSPRSRVYKNKLYAKDVVGGSKLKTLVDDYPVRSINEPLNEAQYNGDTMLAIPMPSPMMMMGSSPKPSDVRVPLPKPASIEGIRNDVPSDKLYRLWQKQLNNCKKMFNIAVNNNNNNNDKPLNTAPITETCNRVGNNHFHSAPSLQQSNTLKKHIQAHLSAYLTNVHNRDADNIKNYDMELPNVNVETNYKVSSNNRL